MRVTIIHLDLGIGGNKFRFLSFFLWIHVHFVSISGAEQLIVNIASSLKELGHDVLIITANHDQNHCFEETKAAGLYILIFF